ncbi:MAG: ABC transporter ATP-binding protein [bacterium]
MVKDLSKRFGSRRLFADLSWELQTGQSMAITGPNGSGKSTLMQILSGLGRPSGGQVAHYEGEKCLELGELRNHLGFVSPYLNLYDQLTAEENLKFFATVAGVAITGRQINDTLARLGLEGRGHDLLATYSSGMKQRLKYAVALLKQPGFLFLDEPTANLDEAGKRLVESILDEHRDKAVIIIATNETQEYCLAQEQCRLGN